MRSSVIDRTHASIYDFSAIALDGRPIPLDSYRGQVAIIVNTASQCGFTPQYEGLEALYRKYKDQGLVILGFPSNQFGAQEPGSEAEIFRFCETIYGVTFPLFSKIDVNGPNAHPLFQFLKSRQPGLFGAVGFSSIKWNFTKFLINREGEPTARYAPSTSPAELTPAIEKLLAAR